MPLSHKSTAITTWSMDDRPREKLLINGAASLTDSELLAILVNTGSVNRSAVEVARDLLKVANNNLDTLGKKSLKDLQSVKGVGEAKAITIAAALELGRRRQVSEALEVETITSSREIYNQIGPLIKDLDHEEFWILLLRRNRTLITKQKLFTGGLHGVYVDAKMIIRNALEYNASIILLAHNHPSGFARPSRQDDVLTDRVKEATLLFDLLLGDHIIVAGHDYYSYLDEGKIV
jgi:DNA repair protein RadC